MYTQIFSILIVTLLVALGLTALFSFGLFVWFFLRMLIAQQDGELFYRNKIKWSAALFGISIGGLFLSGAAGSILVSKVQENIDRANEDQKPLTQRYGDNIANLKIEELYRKYENAKGVAENNTNLKRDFVSLEGRVRSLFSIDGKTTITSQSMKNGASTANSGRFEILLSDFESFLKNQ